MLDEKKIASLKRRYGNRIANAPRKRHGPGARAAAAGGGKPRAGRETVERLLSYLDKDKKWLLVAFICVVVSTLSGLAGSYMLRPIINRYIVPLDGSRGDSAGLFKALVLMAVIYLLSVAVNYMQSRIMLTVAQNALQRLREDLFSKMQKLPLRFYDTNSNGDLMSRFTNDVDTIGNMLSSTLIQLFSGALSIIGTLALMLYTNIYLTLITIVLLPLMMKAGGFVAGKSQKYFSAQQSALGALNGYVEETVQGQKAVKVLLEDKNTLFDD
ncbi:MAG: ABC transporter ATP-binding protein, partial [Clostridium sp.]